MSGRVCVVTGANAGIGKATATALAQQGAHVVLACRSLSKGEAACADIRRKVPGAAVETLPLDLESIESIRGFVKSFRQTSLPLHVLINNAGIIPGKPASVRGMEKSMVVNHLGPFLLTSLLLPDLRRSSSSSPSISPPSTSAFSSSSPSSSAPVAGAGASAERDPTPPTPTPGKTPPASRIVNVASRLEKRGRLPAVTAEGGGLPPGTHWFEPPPGKHDAFQLYGSSKLCNLLFTFELQRRLSAAAAAQTDVTPGTVMVPPRAIDGGVIVSAVTPRVVNTALGDGTVNPWVAWAAAPLKMLFMRDAAKGAETVVWAATSQKAEELAAAGEGGGGGGGGGGNGGGGGGEGEGGGQAGKGGCGGGGAEKAGGGGRGGGGGRRGRGMFFGDMKEVPCSDAAKDESLAARLWEASEAASGLEESERWA